MLYTLLEIETGPVALSVILGALMGLFFGVAAQISRFCLRRGLVVGSDRPQALGVWLFALAVALVATQAAVLMGVIDVSEHRLAAPIVPALAAALGGILFGVGMVLTRGCVSRLTVLSGSGNLRAATVLIVFALIAHATLKGVLAPVRVAIGSVGFDLGDASTAHGFIGGAPLWTAIPLVGLLAIVARSGASMRNLALAGVIGLLVPLGWFGTGVFLYDDFDPIALQSMSFAAPWADTLFWSIASTSIPAGFGTGLIGGVITGAALSALIRREAKLESFESPTQTLRYVGGGSLMGFGGVLAGGCTIGAGLSGVSSLSVAAFIALGGIALGALATDRLVDRRGIATKAAMTPAE